MFYIERLIGPVYRAREGLIISGLAFTPFLRSMNGVMLGGRMFVHLFVRPFVRASVTKYAIMYYEQTAGSRSVISCTCMQVDNILLHVDSHSSPQRA